MDHFCEPYKTNHGLYLGLKAGVNDAYCCLADRLEGVIQNLCQKECLQDWEDVMQDAMVLLLRKIEDGTYEFRDNISPVTYTVVIAKNLILNAKRKQKRNSKLSIEDFIHTLKTENDWNGLKEEVNMYLSFLNETCKQVIKLHKMDGFKYEEIVQHQMIRNFKSNDALRVKSVSCWAKLVEVYKSFNKDADASSN
jgi:RNA polymerase sigma factor (sigma-70 family)